MAAADSNENDFYAVLGLQRECTDAELKNAYKKLAMKWHPDRVSASGNLKHVEEAKKKFQAIQQAYSVLSDANKRFLYDVGVYDSNDEDDETGMGEFLNEMTSMMNQAECDENENFEELQELFDQMFQSDIDGLFGSCSHFATSSSCSPSSTAFSNSTCPVSSKRSSSEMSSRDEHVQGFCVGTSGKSGKHQNGKKYTRKGKR